MQEYLNTDVIGIILGELHPAQIVNFSIVCKYYLKIYRRYMKTQERDIGDYQLSNMQFIIRDEFSRMNGVMAVEAHMGWGKTILGYACCSNVSLILATSNTYKVWVKEAIKIGWYNYDPKKSKVLCFHSSRQKHKKYIEALPADRSKVIILTTDKKAEQAIGIITAMQSKYKRTVIVDEAHVASRYVIDLQSYIGNDVAAGHVFHRELLLSATKMDRRLMCFTGSRDYPINRYIKVLSIDKVPALIWEVEHMEQPFNSDIAAWSVYIKTLIKKTDKTVILCTKDQFMALTDQKIFRRTKIFKLKQGVSTTEAFDKYNERAILFINTNQNEGLNLLAKRIICIHPGTMNVDRIIQSSGRIVRPTNPRKKVYINCLCYGNHEVAKIYYAKAYSYREWLWSYNKYPNDQFLMKVIAFMRALGTSVTTISQIDACILFADFDTLTDTLTTTNLVEWWEKNTRNSNIPSVLSADFIADII
jgi:hypothetical protein